MSIVHRREFLRRSAALGALAFAAPGAYTRGAFGPGSPNEKLNIAIVGTANRAASNIEGVQGENIVALCDVDDLYLGKAAERFPGAKTYNDFRKMLEQPGNDAVVVSTASNRAAAVQARSRAGLDSASLRQRSSVPTPTPTSRATSSNAALSGGNNRATALSLNACPYFANSLSHHRPRFIDCIGATSILTRGDGDH